MATATVQPVQTLLDQVNVALLRNIPEGESVSSLTPCTKKGCVEIHTPRLILRAAEPDDLMGYYECFTDPEAMRYWSCLPHTSIFQSAEWVGKMIHGVNNGRKDFTVVHRESNQVLGKMGVWSDDEVGYLFNRRYWGQGLATEGLAALLDHLFNVEGMETITADVDPRNEASLRLLKKAGFRVTEIKEKTMQVGEEWVDSVLLRMDKPAKGEVGPSEKLQGGQDEVKP